MPKAAMTGADIYEMVTGLLGGLALETGLFYNLLELAQSKIESARPWMILRKQDTSKTVTTSNTFLTAIDLPADFDEWQTERELVLVDVSNNNNFIDCFKEVTSAWGYTYQYQTYRYFCDYAAKKLYISGTVDKSYKLVMNYKYEPDGITDVTSWVFPAKFHKLLAYAVAALNKGGIDFDDQNARMAGDNKETVQSIYDTMIEWDSRLQEHATEGIFRGTENEQPWLSGHVDIYGT